MRLTTKEYKALRRLCREAERYVSRWRAVCARYIASWEPEDERLVHALNEVVPLLEVERLRLIYENKRKKIIPPEQDNPRRLV